MAKLFSEDRSAKQSNSTYTVLAHGVMLPHQTIYSKPFSDASKATVLIQKGSLARQILLASAGEASEEKWLVKLRVMTTSFAGIYRERQRIDPYRESLMAIAGISEKLAQAGAPALSTSSLIHNEVA